MQREKVPYNPALDDGGGAPGAEPQRYIPGEMGDGIYTDPFEPNNDAIRSLSYQKPPELYMPQIPSADSIASLVPLHTQPPENLFDFDSYHYLRSHLSSMTQSNFSDPIHPSNDNFHSQSTAVPIQSNNIQNLYMYHYEVPIIPVGQVSGVGSNGYSLWPRPTFTGYDNDPISIPLLQSGSFDVSDKSPLESAQFYLPPAQNDVGDPQSHNAHNLTASQGLCNYTSLHQLTPGPFSAALSPNVPIPVHLNIRENSNWFAPGHPTEPQAIDMDFMPVPPELQALYASPPYPRMDQSPPPFTGEPFFNSSQLYSPPNYWESSPSHEKGVGNRAHGGFFDPTGVGTAYQRAHLYGHAEQTPPPVSEITIPSLASLHHSPEIWPGSTPRRKIDLSGSGLLITANQHGESPPQSISSSSEVFGYTSQASGNGSSDGALSSSPKTMIQAGVRTPAADPPDTPDYGGLNTFLSQRNSLSRVNKRSRQCRPRVLKHDDCPPNLRPYYKSDIPIPRHECDTMYKQYGDKEYCIKCGYDVTPPRRPGLKYEHVSAHIDNRPYYCFKWREFHDKPVNLFLHIQ